MANPVLNDRVFARAANESAPGWGAPSGFDPVTSPMSDGPVSPFKPDRMTMAGSMRASAILFALLIAGAAVGWNLVGTDNGTVAFPGWLMLPLFGALGIAFLTFFKPHLARYTGPAYALLEGLVVGAISAVYQSFYDGIVIQAMLATMGVFGGMLFLYSQRIIKVNDRMRKMIVAATFGIMAIYLVNFVMRLFGSNLNFVNSAGGLGIAFSLLVVGVAAFNLLLDFDFIERGVKAALPKHMEWFAAFGLLVTVVWLYLEMLRLLSKLQRR